jgi:PPOX class probable F420-dependent enzyme
MAPTFDDIAKAKHILLTTFTKAGRPKPTAIWAAPDGERLLVITEEDSWKVKRIRNTPRVTLAICDLRGKPTSEAIEAVATVLDKVRGRRRPAGGGEALRADRLGVRGVQQAARAQRQGHWGGIEGSGLAS